MIRTLAVYCAPILDCYKDVGKTAAKTACDEMVMGAVRAIGEFSLLVSQLNHLDLFLNALDDALKRFYQKKGILGDQIMSKSSKTTVDEPWAREFHLLREQKIYKIRAAMAAIEYGAENVSPPKCRQFQMRLN
jgi:hypothetical protein